MKVLKLSEIRTDQVALRRALFFAAVAVITFIATTLMADALRIEFLSWLDFILLGVFVLLSSQIAAGFCLGLFGFFETLRPEGDPYRISNTIREEESIPLARTAIVMPVFNEDIARVLQGVENMFLSVESTGEADLFDFFILSDSDKPDCWLKEEWEWVRLCKKLNAFGRIFYRKRRVPVHGKSGNVADFCRRWGRKYRYMIVLDADSIMAGSIFVRLVRMMERNPEVGIIQTAPYLVRGVSLFRRVVQFTHRMCGPVLAAGSNYWHLGTGNYWGHNAIIRLEPFMNSCDLPDLPGPAGTRLHIMSHDTVEAALMRRAGYDVWFAYDEPGSYEEGPPNLTESLKRDRRWCQGNLQHFWFLFARNINFSNRLHIYFGLMSYLGSPLWLLFLVLSALNFHEKARFAFLSSMDESIRSEHSAKVLLVLTLTLLFLPKFLGLAATLRRSREFGGVIKLFASALLETLLSVLAAPILMLFHTRFVVMTMLGMRMAWKTQNRSDEVGLSWAEAAQTYAWVTLTGLIAGAAVSWFLPSFLPWLIPVLAGWVLSVPFAYFTSLDRVGRWMLRHRFFMIPEETNPPAEFSGLDHPSSNVTGAIFDEAQHDGLRLAVLDPYVNAVHVSLLRPRPLKKQHAREYMKRLQTTLITGGPDKLTTRERVALLSDAESLAQLHKSLWSQPAQEMNGWWRDAMRKYSRQVVDE